jgi:hypothetical protein
MSEERRDPAGASGPALSWRRWLRGWRLALLIGAAVIGVLLIALPFVTEIVDKGRNLRPYPSDGVRKLLVLDEITIYIDSESRSVGPDLISGIALIALATAAAMTLLLLGLAGATGRLLEFYTVTALGLLLLGLDEMAGLHESVGHNLPFLADIPGVEHPDDIIFALYWIPAVLYVVWFRDVLLGTQLTRRLFITGVVMLALAGAADVAGSSFDDLFEVLSAAGIGGGLVVLMAKHLADGLRLRELRARAGS